jgi:DNA-binding beta-propeller fold protein YncE
MPHDINNPPGGPHLVVTAKTANKVQLFDVASFTLTGTLDMPGSTHELVLSADGAQAYGTIYGGGIFGKNTAPDRRIAVIDLAGKSLARTIDINDVLAPQIAPQIAPHGIMRDGQGTLWATAELAQSVLAIDPATGATERVAVGGAPHWLAISHSAGLLFASLKATSHVAIVDLRTRRFIGMLDIPHRAEGLAVSGDGKTLYVCAHETNELHVFDVGSRALSRTLTLEGAPGAVNQLRRVRISPDGRFLLVASHVDNHVAVFDAHSLAQTGWLQTPKAPMGFGFASDGVHAFVCCHDAAVLLEFDMAQARETRRVETAAGCEFVIAYGEA